MKSMRKDQRGVAHLILIVLVIVVIAVIAFVGWKLMQNRKSVTSTVATTVASTEAQTACTKLYNDKNLCKFVASYQPNASFKATYATTDAAGKTTTMLIDQDGKGNSSMVMKDGSSETSAFISLNGDTYLKNESTGTWVKYPKGPESAAATPASSDLTLDDVAKQAALPEAQRVTYKSLGKEKCGNATCFKYQIIDPTQTDVKESIVWFGDKDYQLHEWSFTNTDGSKSVGQFDYTNVTINVPSPVTDASSAGASVPDMSSMTNQ